jgi:hypothetical protein
MVRRNLLNRKFYGHYLQLQPDAWLNAVWRASIELVDRFETLIITTKYSVYLHDQDI